ncbi:MAG: hypothetical protein CMM25_01750 [Rhodospirillaceae bacterium]|mgnify:CR=1 FL=1|nr:hypothetical protein [Rhodospirillaceae bacterium]
MAPQITELKKSIVQNFLLGDGTVRGKFSRMDSVVDDILRKHNYPDSVSQLLGETIIATVILSSGLKFNGKFSLQVKGDGPLSTLLVDVTSGGDVRAYANFDKNSELIIRDQYEKQASFGQLMGEGYIAFTVHQGPALDRYQGVVELRGNSILESVQNYFSQSEQIDMTAKVIVRKVFGGGCDFEWRGGAIMLEKMPIDSSKAVKLDSEDLWTTSCIFLKTVTDEELLSVPSSKLQLIAHLFSTIGYNVIGQQFLISKCKCTREKSGSILASFRDDEVSSISENGIITMTCEFCETKYAFSEPEITNYKSTHY